MTELLNAGDWACAHGDPEALGNVVRELAALLPDDAAPMASAISAHCGEGHCLCVAAAAWGRLAALLRARADAAVSSAGGSRRS